MQQCGSMGGGMALLFAEHRIRVLLQDPNEESVNQLLATAKKDGLQDMVEKHGDYQDLCNSLDKPRVFVFSLPHGTVGDTVVDGLHPYLEKGDIIIDASNEHVSPSTTAFSLDHKLEVIYPFPRFNMCHLSIHLPSHQYLAVDLS